MAKAKNQYSDIDKLITNQNSMLDKSLKKQQDITNKQTALNVAELQRDKAEIDQDVDKTNKALYSEYKKASNPYGSNAENLYSQGLGNSGYAESTQTNLYNTYQNNITNTLNNARDLKADFDFQISKARQTGDITLAQNALDIYNSKMQLLTQEYELRNNKDQFLYQQKRDTIGDRQWAKEFKEQQRQNRIANKQWGTTFKYQQQRDAVGDSQWEKEYELSKKASASSSSRRSSGTSNRNYSSNNDVNSIDLNENNATAQLLRVAEDVLAIKKPDGSYATLNISKDATDEQIKRWGEQNGISNILDYLS